MSDYQVTFVTPQGVHVPFDDVGSGLYITDVISETMLPPVAYDVAEPSDMPGELILGRKFGARLLNLPVALLASTLGDFKLRARALASRMNPMLGNGLLLIDLDGDVRQIGAVYNAGLEGEHETTAWGDTWYETTVTWRCTDPFFLDAVDRTLGPFHTSISDVPFFPMFDDPANVGPHFGSSSVFNALNVTNLGDDIAYPIWRLDGPALNPIFVNNGTAEVLALSAGLALGPNEYVIIDTRPTGATPKSVLTWDGQNAFRTIADGSAMWGFQLGDNPVTVTVDGANDQTALSAVYRQRYLAL